ncbi:hypothetical protein MHYP_G00044270 [Metynnis hypsauchen]
MDEADKASQASSAGTRKSTSSVSIAARARAKAEAARARAFFAEKEAQLKVEQARMVLEQAKLDAELGRLALQREAAAAEAHAEALEAAEVNDGRTTSRKEVDASPRTFVSMHTTNYVKEQMKLHSISHADASMPSIHQSDDSLITKGSAFFDSYLPQNEPVSPAKRPIHCDNGTGDYLHSVSRIPTPQPHGQPHYTSSVNRPQLLPMTDFAKYLARPDQDSGCRGWHRCLRPHRPEELSQASNIIIKSVQAETYLEECAALANGKLVNKNSPLFKLNPKVDEGLIRIGGRLSNAQLESREKNPLVLPKNHHVSTLLVRHFHEKDDQAARNMWPMAVVESVYPSADGKVRKVELRIVNQGASKTLLRPVSQVIFLFPSGTAS